MLSPGVNQRATGAAISRKDHGDTGGWIASSHRLDSRTRRRRRHAFFLPRAGRGIDPGITEKLTHNSGTNFNAYLLESTLAAMDNEADDRGDFWYAIQRPIVLSLLGRKDEALQALRVSVERSDMHYNSWYFLEIDPTIAGLRSDARFIELRNTVRTSLARQRQRLAELRSGGLIPLRP